MLFARMVLLVQVLVLTGLGLAYWFRPYEMANLSGMLLMESVSVSNARVYYGGLQLGLALFLLWSMRRLEWISGALVLLLMMQLSLVLARLITLHLDGDTLQALDLLSLLYKLASAILAGGALYRLDRGKAEEVAPELPILTDRLDDGVPEVLLRRGEEAVPPAHMPWMESPAPSRQP